MAFLSAREAAALLSDIDPAGAELVMVKRAGQVVHLRLEPRAGRPVIVEGGMKTSFVVDLLNNFEPTFKSSRSHSEDLISKYVVETEAPRG